MKKIFSCGHVIGGALLVAGTSIGAGMLALPIVTGLGGFLPAFVVYLISWIVMTASGILYIEPAARLSKESNIISIAQTFLGNKGKFFTWIIYLFLFYSLTVSYISAGGQLFQTALPFVSPKIAIIIFTFLFALFVYWGTRIVDRVNFLLMAGLIISYLFFLFLGMEHVDIRLLTVVNWKKSVFSLPIVIISFGYQGIVPTLTHYLKNDVKKVKTAIILGTSIAFVIYLLWELLILGIIPLEGPHGLIQAEKLGETAVEPLKFYTKASLVYTIGRFFSFCAVTTSFLGVTLALLDFLSDGLHIAKKGAKKLFLALLTFFPPLIISLIYPHLFLVALRYAGGIGGTLLLILLPAIVAYVGRYKNKKWQLQPYLPGGKIVLFLLYIFVFFVLIMEILYLFF